MFVCFLYTGEYFRRGLEANFKNIMGLHDDAPTVIINSLYTTFLVLCIPMQTLQSDESSLPSFSKGTMKSSTGFDQLVSFDPSSQYTFANYNGSDISAGVVSIGVDYSSRTSNEYEDTTLDSIPIYSRTVESVYSIESPIYTVTWIPTHPSAVFAGSSDVYHLTPAHESNFPLNSILIPIMSIVTSSFVQPIDISILKHQSYDSNFATTFLDHDLVPLEGISSVKSLSTVNAGEIAPTSLIDTLVMPTGTTELLKSSFTTFATSCSIPYSTSLHDDHISSLYINITDEIQRTYLNVPGNSVNSSTESLVEQWSGWIQPTRTQTQVETESLDSVLSTSYSHSGFVTEFISVVTAFISVANADQISYNFQTSSLVHTGNLKFETSNTKDFKVPLSVDGSFQATERMYTTEMMDDYLSIQTNTGVISIFYSISDVPFYSDKPNGAFLSSSHPHASTTRSIQASFDTRAAQEFSKTDFFSFTTGYSVHNVSGGMFHASHTDTADESFLVSDFATKLSSSPTNSSSSQTSFHDGNR
ncbi:hypothetical protein CHS0354_008719 [Potamilus streckersoni]|uniref:Uncharacterized protein n=1 Tax=Potamilus streckersoni TaxID=2493646 RepID=A0AAE0SC91_9BIVA|nr:hypothetical protein CHS0354_008719 [Potamilus streckersoni]